MPQLGLLKWECSRSSTNGYLFQLHGWFITCRIITLPRWKRRNDRTYLVRWFAGLQYAPSSSETPTFHINEYVEQIVCTFHVQSCPTRPPHPIPSFPLSCFYPTSISSCCHFAPNRQIVTADISLHPSHHALCRHQPPASVNVPPKTPCNHLDSGPTKIRRNRARQHRRHAAGCSAPRKPR